MLLLFKTIIISIIFSLGFINPGLSQKTKPKKNIKSLPIPAAPEESNFLKLHPQIDLSGAIRLDSKNIREYNKSKFLNSGISNNEKSTMYELRAAQINSLENSLINWVNSVHINWNLNGVTYTNMNLRFLFDSVVDYALRNKPRRYYHLLTDGTNYEKIINELDNNSNSKSALSIRNKIFEEDTLSIKIRAMLYYGSHFSYPGNREKINDFYQEAIDEVVKHSIDYNYKNFTTYFSIIGDHFKEYNQYEWAMKAYFEAIKYCDEKKDYSSQMFFYGKIADLYSSRYFFPEYQAKSMDFYQKINAFYKSRTFEYEAMQSDLNLIQQMLPQLYNNYSDSVQLQNTKIDIINRLLEFGKNLSKYNEKKYFGALALFYKILAKYFTDFSKDKKRIDIGIECMFNSAMYNSALFNSNKSDDPNLSSLIESLQNLSELYSKIGDKNLSYYYVDKAIEISQKNKDSISLKWQFLDKANSSITLKEYDTAKFYLYKVLDTTETNIYYDELDQYSYSTASYLYRQLNKNSIAANYDQKYNALSSSYLSEFNILNRVEEDYLSNKSEGLESEIAHLKKQLDELVSSRANLESKIKQLKLEFSQKEKSYDEKLNSLGDSLNDKKNNLIALKSKIAVVTDSLNKKVAKVKEAEKRAGIAIDRERKAWKIFWWVIGFSTLILIGIILGFYGLIKRKETIENERTQLAEEKVEAEKKEKENEKKEKELAQFKILHHQATSHEIKTFSENIVGFVDKLRDDVKEKDSKQFKENLDVVYQKVSSINNYVSSHHTTSDNIISTLADELTLSTYYIDVFKKVKHSKKQYNISLSTNSLFNEMANNIIVPSRLINSFIMNSLNHGLLPDRKEINIKLDLTEIENGYKLEIDDNGCGINFANEYRKEEKTKSTGIKWVEDYIDMYNKKENPFTISFDKSTMLIDKADKGYGQGTKVILFLKRK